MKKLLTTFLFCFITFTAVSQDWQRFKSEKYEFIVDFPDEPEYSSQDVPTDIGNIVMHMFNAPGSNGLSYYGVIRSDYPEEMIKDKTYKSMLDGAVNGAVTNVNGKAEFDKEITINGFPGRDIKVIIEGGVMYMRIFLVNNTLYALQALYVYGSSESDVKKFQDSFDIIKVKNN